ncbi:YeeE/YedE family protein [Sinimarinibacterium sp. CAU 1509]|uniref:YeeE/YedE family protein n=1 Tax=Sinimarinibacterium sp. CAU 1509 TaxID=2562283 RepID=UPI0010AC6C25|nr:YeeE/YedE family protein [Sinimarinibacterium sp. CAU 1509]TJY62037.1 YeeE/YedE family protein [Sinimarinibacterium sp. CAU 1509]
MSGWVIESVAGGAMIGLASALLLLGSGQIAGISGVAATLTRGDAGAGAWRLLFIAGLVSAPLLYVAATGRGVGGAIELPLPLIIGAGALVGFGTRSASGCTSGHGVCGLGNLSARSLVAVALFMSTAALTVFVSRHLIGA